MPRIYKHVSKQCTSQIVIVLTSGSCVRVVFFRMPQHCVPARRCRRHRVVMKRRPPYGLRRCRLAKYFEAVSIRQLLESSPFINWVQVPGCLVFYIHITRATHGSLSFWLPQVLPGTYRHVSIFCLEIFSVHELITHKRSRSEYMCCRPQVDVP